MANRKTTRLLLVELEPRALLAGFHPGAGAVPPPSPAVQADLLKIQQDQQQLHTDIKTLAPTLAADQQAIASAIDHSTSVQAARKTLANDIRAFGNTIAGDWFAIFSANSASARAADFAKLNTDIANGTATLQADNAAIQNAIKNDPNVQAAVQKYQADFAPIQADETALQADFAQLQNDLKGGSTTTGSGPTSGGPVVVA